MIIKTGAKPVKSPPGRPSLPAAASPRLRGPGELCARPSTSLATIAASTQTPDPPPLSVVQGISAPQYQEETHTHSRSPHRPKGQTGGAAQRSRPEGPLPSPAGSVAPLGSPRCRHPSLCVHLTVEGHKCLLRAAAATRSPALSWSRHFPGPATM